MKLISVIGLSCLVAFVIGQSHLTDMTDEMERVLKHPSECCTGRPLIDESALTACKAKFPDHTDETGQIIGSCIMECYFNQTEIYKNGVFVRATAVSVLGVNMDESMKKILADAVEACFSEYEQYKNPPFEARIGGENRNEKDNKQEIHSRNSSDNLLIPCIEYAIFHNCPADKKITNKDCNSLVELYSKNVNEF